ncbi:MAG: hypothetical protein H0W61_03790 [Bacteroidetes bacterium]|nr:hypothetical protein [Bacteroidota bacterium]
MNIKELLDDENLDPEKLFDENEYSTLLVNREGFNKKENDIADLIESLLEPEIDRAELEAIFSKLKEKNARGILIESIKKAGKVEEKTKLAAACWETGLDFTNDILFFTELACSNNFALAMEALTVVENIEGVIAEETLSKTIEIAQNCKSPNTSITEDLINNLRQRAL